MEINQRLAKEHNAWLATVRPDGRPHVTPVWFVYIDGRFWVGTGRDNVKTRNVLSNPAVVITLEDGVQPVVAEGTAVVHQNARPDAVVAAFTEKYGWDITLSIDPDVGAVVLWEITPRRWPFGAPQT